jgi:hypothetical protein
MAAGHAEDWAPIDAEEWAPVVTALCLRNKGLATFLSHDDDWLRLFIDE